MKKIFVSFPYSDPDNSVTLERVDRAREYCWHLITLGHAVFAPALFGHDLVSQVKLPISEQDMTFKSWDNFCYAYLEPCNEFHLLKINGYKESTGCAGERAKAIELDIPVLEIDIYSA